VAGDSAPLIASNGAWAPDIADFKQAFVSWKPGSSGFEMRLGKFVTSAGYEVIPAWDNLNRHITNSYLFGFAVPFTQTGLRAQLPVGTKVTLSAGVNRGWDQFEDNNDSVSFEVAVAATPRPGFSVVLDTHHGPDQEGEGKNYRRLYDLVCSLSLNSRLTVGLNVDYATEEKAAAFVPHGTAKWYGAAAYLTYAIRPSLALSTRLEQFRDRDGARTGVAQTLREADLTLDWTAHSNLVVRVGGRMDSSTAEVFEDGSKPSKRQTSLAMAVVVKR
jgi:Putative beta-barrel porin-2, OmpL-like. bbp2